MNASLPTNLSTSPRYDIQTLTHPLTPTLAAQITRPLQLSFIHAHHPLLRCHCCHAALSFDVVLQRPSSFFIFLQTLLPVDPHSVIPILTHVPKSDSRCCCEAQRRYESTLPAFHLSISFSSYRASAYLSETQGLRHLSTRCD